LKKLISIFFALLAFQALADNNYYPLDFQNKIHGNLLKDEALKTAINTVLTSGHKKDSKGGADTIGCDANTDGCYGHFNLGYDGARRILFGQIHLKNDSNGFYIEDVYCQKRFSGGSKVGPNAIPNQNQINCEHTWPQSKFSNRYPKEVQKADLHHLFPSDSKANGIRGNFDFADVSSDNGSLAEDNCEASKSGSSVTGGGDDYFEPPKEHKGNVARALFYFSVRYQISIPKAELEFLRKWDELDPIDQAEIDRNETVFKYQKNRNPFVDYPGLAKLINNF
jgi:deoxyribonuclease-1